MAEPVAGQSQTVQDHSEELFNMRSELFNDRRNYAKAMDALMVGKVAAGVVDLQPAQEQAYESAMQLAGLNEMLKNAAAFPASQDKTVTTERTSQTLSEDTTQNVIDRALEQVSKTMATDIERTIQEGMASLTSLLKNEIESAIADVQEGE
jgi:hypothetical protein